MQQLTSTVPDGFSRPGVTDPVYRFRNLIQGVHQVDLAAENPGQKFDQVLQLPRITADHVIGFGFIDDLEFWQDLARIMDPGEFDRAYDHFYSLGKFGANHSPAVDRRIRRTRRFAREKAILGLLVVGGGVVLSLLSIVLILAINLLQIPGLSFTW